MANYNFCSYKAKNTHRGGFVTYSKFILSLFLATNVGLLSSCGSKKSPNSTTVDPTPLPPDFVNNFGAASPYDSSNFELLDKSSPEYMKFVKENLDYEYRRKVQETKQLNGLENIWESKVYYSFGTLVTQEKKQLNTSSSDAKKFTESTSALSMLVNNESLLKNPNILLSTVDVEVKESEYNNNIYQTLNFDDNSYKFPYESTEEFLNLIVYKKYLDLHSAELKKHPFLNCKKTKTISDENENFSYEIYKHKTIPHLYYTKYKTQGKQKCEDEDNSYDIGKTINTSIHIIYFAHESWFYKYIYSDYITEYVDHNYTLRVIRKSLKKSY